MNKCAKCGGEAVVLWAPRYNLYYCQCRNCGVMGDYAQTRAEAIEKWNKVKKWEGEK